MFTIELFYMKVMQLAAKKAYIVLYASLALADKYKIEKHNILRSTILPLEQLGWRTV